MSDLLTCAWCGRRMPKWGSLKLEDGSSAHFLGAPSDCNAPKPKRTPPPFTLGSATTPDRTNFHSSEGGRPTVRYAVLVDGEEVGAIIRIDYPHKVTSHWSIEGNSRLFGSRKDAASVLVKEAFDA